MLVHGGFHGAWCWEKVVPELRSLGYDTLAIDLPGHGARLEERGTLESYRRAVVEVVEDGDVLVGHSMAGYVLAMAADEVGEKVGRLVYLAASTPVEGKAIIDCTPMDEAFADTLGMSVDEYTATVKPPGQGECVIFTDKETVISLFYHDCSPADQAWALERITPQPLEPLTTPIHVPRFWDSPIPRNFILCTDDRSHPVQMDNGFMTSLGVSRCIGMKTSHSPFISQPEETARVLDLCARGVV